MFLPGCKKYIAALAILILAVAGGVRAEETIGWKECVKEARAEHPDLIAAAEKIKQFKASKEITRGAALPQITGGASGITSKGPSFSSSGAVASTASLRKADTTYQYDVTGQQLLFDGFKTSYDLSTAQRNIIASRYSYDVTSSNIRLRLRTAFANLLSAQELLKVAIQIRNRRKQNLELVRLRYEGGREHIGSLMTSEADLAQAEYEVRQAERAIYLSQRQLTKEMGRTFFSPMSAEGSLEVKETQGKIPDFEKLTATNPFLQQLIAEKDAARFGLKSAYSEFFPQVYASANIGNVNVNAFPDKNEYSYGMTMTFPLFEGGTRFANVSKAKATLGQAAQDERSGHDTVILTLSDTWTKLRDALDNIAVRRKYLEATEVRARIAEQEYAIGLMSFDNWIIIEDNLVSAKRTLVESQLTALTAEASWVQAKGGTLDYDQE